MSTAVGKTNYRLDWQSDGTADLILNSNGTTLINDISLLIGGIAAGYKIARGATACTATAAVATGLATIVAGFAIARADTATKADAAVSITTTPQASTAGTLGIFRWKATGPSTDTLVAATVAGSVDWFAIGT